MNVKLKVLAKSVYHSSKLLIKVTRKRQRSYVEDMNFMCGKVGNFVYKLFINFVFRIFYLFFLYDWQFQVQ